MAALVQECLEAIGIDVAEKEVLLSDEARITATTVYTTPTQLERAADQMRQLTGESIDPETLQRQLNWE